jgi:hypothetical protein
LDNKVIRQGLRDIRPDEVDHIQKVAKCFPGLSRHELAQTLCEHLSWYSPSGAPKVKNCLTLLDRLIGPRAINPGQTASLHTPHHRTTLDKRPIEGLLPN